jgi:dienelactone hydrolase
MSVLTTPETVSLSIPIEGGYLLPADIVTPPDAKGVVLFAHGSGSSRRSPRNRFVAGELNSRHLATILADLLTEQEERIDDYTGKLRFDIAMLTGRMIALIDWTAKNPRLGSLPLGLFGASTGAAAALDAAAARPGIVHAVVSRGGRPDLATRLEAVHAATLLIVGGNDPVVRHMNAAALDRLNCRRELQVVPGATHLFPEPGALEIVASSAGAWFESQLTRKK